jgi:hypothetical protein
VIAGASTMNFTVIGCGQEFLSSSLKPSRRKCISTSSGVKKRLLQHLSPMVVQRELVWLNVLCSCFFEAEECEPSVVSLHHPLGGSGESYWLLLGEELEFLNS